MWSLVYNPAYWPGNGLESATHNLPATMAKSSAFKYDQFPMFVPESEWQPPTELPDLSEYREISIDLETKDTRLSNGYGPGFFTAPQVNQNGSFWKYDGYVCGIAVAYGKKSIYIPLMHLETKCWDMEVVSRWLKKLAQQNHTRFVFHNFSYDWGWLEATFKIKPPALLDDTSAMASMVDENLPSYSLDNLCIGQGLPGKDEQLLNEAAAAYNIPKKEIKQNLWRLPAKYVGPYAEQDAMSTLALAAKLRPLIVEEKLEGAYETERELMPLTLKMKQRGIRVDRDKADQLAKEILIRCDEELIELSNKIGQKVSIDELRSNRWLTVKFDDMRIDYPRTPATNAYPNGQPSFEKNFMSTHDHWFPKTIQRIKHQNDLAEKFLRGFICAYSVKGRIHASVNQFKNEGGGTRSHRFSYADPPLQQMPSRDDVYAPLIRSCFLPEPGEKWCSVDYRQQEYRLIVYVAEVLNAKGARTAGDMYRSNPATDYHNYVADITRLPRRRAKDVNFAKSYGAGVPKFALMTGMSLEESAEVIKQYDKELPFVREASETFARLANQRGFIRLIDGARGHFNLWEPIYRNFLKEKSSKFDTTPCSEQEYNRRKNDPDHPWYKEKPKRSFTHKAFNRMIQGSAARQMKIAMVNIYKAGYEPLIQMHDELGFSFTNEKEGIECARMMEQAIPAITIPMLTDTEWGPDWGHAKYTYEEALKK